MTRKLDAKLLWPPEIPKVACERCLADEAVFALSMRQPDGDPDPLLYLCFDCLLECMLGAVADYVTDRAAFQVGATTGEALKEKYGKLHAANEARRKRYREANERPNVRRVPEAPDDGTGDGPTVGK